MGMAKNGSKLESVYKPMTMAKNGSVLESISYSMKWRSTGHNLNLIQTNGNGEERVRT